MLTPRENLLKVFRHEKPEWIPITGFVNAYSQPGRDGMDPALAKAFENIKGGDGNNRTFSLYLGLDVMNYVIPPVSKKRSRVSVSKITQTDGWVNVFKTPLGELSEVYKEVRRDGTWYITEHLVKSGDDLPILEYIFKDEEFLSNNETLEFMHNQKTLLGDQGIIYTHMPGTPMGMMVRLYSGVEGLAYLWADYRKELSQLFKAMEGNYLRQYQLYASLGFDMLQGMDDTSTTTISPAMFEEFCMEYTDHVADVVHKYGAIYTHHSCGLISNLLHLYRRTRMDAVDALSLKPLGDIISLAEAKDSLGPDIAVITPVDLQILLTMDNPDMVKEKISQMFTDVSSGENIIFKISAHPHINMEQTAFIAQECKKHQRKYS